MKYVVSRAALMVAAFGVVMLAGPVQALAAEAPADTTNVAAAVGPAAPADIVVTARRLAAARATIQPAIGASSYTIDAKAIAALPSGENVSMNQVILQAPGVAQDSYGQLHIRGEHNGLQFRLDGVILPEGLSVFSQALSPRLADKIQLLTGALPAEYGLRTAGVVDITTKDQFDNKGSVSVYGGSHGDVQPSFDYSGHNGGLNYFVSLSYQQDGLGIESPDGRSNPLHDKTDQFQGFGFVEDIIDPASKASLIVGSSIQRFQIPDLDLQPANGGLMGGATGAQPLSVDGQTSYPSQDLNENQREVTHYVIANYLHSTERFTGQVSLFARYSTLSFSPDALGDVLYDGIAQTAAKSDTAGGLQAEGVYHLSPAHTLRAGVILEIDHSTSQTSSLVIPYSGYQGQTAGPALAPGQVYCAFIGQSGCVQGAQLTQTPITIGDNGEETAKTYSVYVQDEWKLLEGLTLNYGLRFDEFDGYRDEHQFSPRANLVWLPLDHTTLHIGYARYFTPPPFELIAAQTVGKFAYTSGAQYSAVDTTPYAERANYYDAGVEQTLIHGMTVGLDTYYKTSTHLIDEGQFGAPIILTPFNYQQGVQYGIELTSAYQHGGLTAYANIGFERARGLDIMTSQFNFNAAELAYSQNRWIYLDHDQKFSGSAGVSYLWRGTRFSTDLIYGSGLRADLPLANPMAAYPGLTGIPNGDELGAYTQVNLGLSHRFKDAALGPWELRLDVINLFDDRYEIRNGTGVGVGAPQFGPRRGVFGGVTKEF